jgi:hypothetical protein
VISSLFKFREECISGRCPNYLREMLNDLPEMLNDLREMLNDLADDA